MLLFAEAAADLLQVMVCGPVDRHRLSPVTAHVMRPDRRYVPILL